MEEKKFTYPLWDDILKKRLRDDIEFREKIIDEIIVLLKDKDFIIARNLLNKIIEIEK